MLGTNKLKEKLSKGNPVLGTWNTLASPLVTEVFAQTGLDFQIIDLEHGPFIIDQVHLHVSACENSPNCTPLVRIPDNNEWMALQALDQGAHGVVVPHIDSVDSAQRLVDATKYYPEGNRGFTPFSKAGGFTNQDIPSYVNRAVNESMNIIIIESSAGLENLDQILLVDNIDIIYFGAYDLSQALGYPGKVNHPEVIKAIQEGVEKVNRVGKYAGGFVPQSKDDIKWLLDMGMKFITYEVDSSILHTHTLNVVDWFLGETN
jgi:4-hydroxy-2-oxoheptanedioate aldolase